MMAGTSDIEIKYVNNNGNLRYNQKLNDMLRTIVPPLTSQCCIFRVPKTLRMIKESAYTPSVISIGPFHHNKDELQFMEKQKVRYLDHYIHKYRVNLDDLLTNITEWEESIRQSYGEQIELSSDDLVMMVLLDAIFVIAYFRINHSPHLKDENDKMLYRLKLKDSIFIDLILLENQLPFIVLESLYNLVFPNEENSFLELSCEFFSDLNKQEIILAQQEKGYLIRTFHLPRTKLKRITTTTGHPKNNGTHQHISSYRAKDLEENGIIFKACPSKCLLDIQFSNKDGVYTIPLLVIEDRTECVFRNMMALEQFKYMDDSYICDYTYLMNTLIDTSQDVELLVRNDIITNNIGDHEKVATLFNNLNNEILVDYQSCYATFREDSSKYHKKSMHKWMASLKRDYFSSPWQIASVSAAFVLLFLTLVQTICSIMQVLPDKPK